MSFAEDIYGLVQRIPYGRVCTYGQIALLCGHPGAARTVGSVLHKNPYGDAVPCHRVVSSRGVLAKTGDPTWNQRRMLEQEGVAFTQDGRVNLALCMWHGENYEI